MLVESKLPWPLITEGSDVKVSSVWWTPIQWSVGEGEGLSEQDKKNLNRLIKRARSVCGYKFSYWKPGWPVCICSQRTSPLFCFVVLIKTIGRKKNCRKAIRPYVHESACADVVGKRFLFRVPITVLSRARGVPFLPRARQGAVYTLRGSNREDKCRQKSSLKPKIKSWMKSWTQRRMSKFRR